MNAEKKNLALTDHQHQHPADVRASLLRGMLVRGDPAPWTEQLLRELRRMLQRTAAVTTFVASLGALTSADASVITWSNALGGSASTAANWSPTQVPSATDDLLFNLNATYTVTLNATVPGSLTQTYREGAVTLNLSNPHTVSNSLLMGTVSGDSPLLTLTTGTLTVNGATAVGNVSGSDATFNVNDDDADLIIGNGADLTVGLNGDANLNITGGGHVEVADQFIAGSNATSSPTILVSGFQLAPIATSSLNVLGLSQSRIGQGGDAAMTISNGAFAHFEGDLVVANGQASISSIIVEDQGLLPARLIVDGDLFLGRNTSATAAGSALVDVYAGGLVDVGDVLSVGGDVNGGGGELRVNAGGEVQTVNMQVGLGGRVSLEDGVLSSDNAIVIDANGELNGVGTINADINNAGRLFPTGTGMTINGMLTNVAGNLTAGNAIHFGPKGGFVGAGTVTAAITGDATSSITPTGTLTIGTNATNGFFFLGDLNVGGNIVTLVDSNQAVLGGETTFNSGRIECPAGIGVQNGAALRGDGLLVGNVTASGVLDPESANPAVQGEITMQGNLVMNPTGVVDAEIRDVPAAATHDRITVSGTATFGGTLRLRVADDFFPYPGMQFIVVNAVGGRVGTFDNIELVMPGPCNGVEFVLVYSSTAAIVLVRPPNADTVRDGVVNVQDLLAVVGAWGPWPGAGGMPIGEVDGDEPVNVADLLYVISRWGCQP